MEKTRVVVDFHIYGDKLIPQLITEKLNITPTRQWLKGDAITGRGKQPVRDKKSSSEERPRSPVKLTGKDLKYLELNPHLVRTRTGAVRRFNNWEISTGYEESNDINIQLTRIFDLLKNKVSVLNELRDAYNLQFRIDVVVIVENGEKPAMYFDHWFIDFVHEIEAEVDIDLYIYS
ncbi:MAG TPA: DUF4279 domain-containing protein [Dehalococcoidales bacterium]